jgi:hypothetical protein
MNYENFKNYLFFKLLTEVLLHITDVESGSDQDKSLANRLSQTTLKILSPHEA